MTKSLRGVKMNKKKVDLLLINPPFHRRNGSGSIFPLGLGYIIAAAKKEGYTCDVINGYSMIDSYDYFLLGTL